MGKRGRPKGAHDAAHDVSSPEEPLGSGRLREETANTGARDAGSVVEAAPSVAAPVETGGRGRGRGRRARRSRRKDKVVPLWRELPMLAGIALVLALVIKTFFVQAFYIPSGSMENTIGIGDRVLVNKFSPWFGATPDRGEVIVFRDPGGWLDKQTSDDPPPVLKQVKQGLVFVGLLPSDDEQDLIKRVIGVGEDTVACCDPSGRVTVNGVPLDEPYIHEGDAPSKKRFSVVVPKGRLWVMGDHRGDSADSRAHMDRPYQGTISQDDVVGRAVVVAWPFGRAHRLSVPATFENKALSVASLPAGPVVMGLAGALPMVLLRRRVRSRRREPVPRGRYRPDTVLRADRKSSEDSCGHRAAGPGRSSCGPHGYEEAPWGKS